MTLGLFVCLRSCKPPRKTFEILERNWFSALKKKKWHDNGQSWLQRGATAYKIIRHFNHPVKVRKIHYQVVEGKQLAEISSRADRFQSLVLHSLYAWVVPGTTEDRALLQCQGQERQVTQPVGLTSPHSNLNISGFTSSCPDELVTGEEKLWPRIPFSEKTPGTFVNCQLLPVFRPSRHVLYLELARMPNWSIFVFLSLRLLFLRVLIRWKPPLYSISKLNAIPLK